MSKKQSALLRIILFSLALLVLVGGSLVLYLFHSFTFSDSQEIITTELGESSFSAGDFDSIEIDWASGTITLSPNAQLTDTIAVREAGSEDAEKMQLHRSGRTLQIQFCKNATSIFGITSLKKVTKDLYIEVPLDWVCNELTVNAASTAVDVTDMEFEEVEFDLASGDLNMDTCKVRSLAVETASGTLIFKGELEELDCDAASADCNIQITNHPRKIEFNSVSGDLELTLPESCGFSVEQDGLDVSLNSDFPTTVQDGRHIYGDGSCKIEANSVSGDISIHKLNP